MPRPYAVGGAGSRACRPASLARSAAIVTTGFNIAEVVTLEPRLHSMLGFTQTQVDAYLKEIIQSYGIAPNRLTDTREVMRNWYNGYRFLPNAQETLYNSTILIYFLKFFVLHEGEYPADMIDPNLKADVSWIKRLGYGDESALELMQSLLLLPSTLPKSPGLEVSSGYNEGSLPDAKASGGSISLLDSRARGSPALGLNPRLTHDTLKTRSIDASHAQHTIDEPPRR